MNSDDVPLRGKTLLLVHTGSPKKRFIFQRLKKLGITILVLHKEKDWAAPYVDHWILADIMNDHECVRSVQRFIKSNPKISIDGVLTFWEESTLLVSKIAEKFHMIGIPFSIAEKVRYKDNFRDFCVKNNLPAPRYLRIHRKDDIRLVKRDLHFPVVVKPVYGSASAFVVKVESESELQEIYQYIHENIATHPDASEWKSFDLLVEEYIDGDEVDVDIILQNGKIKFFSISDNNKTEEPFFVETGQSIPSILPEHDQRSLIALAEETLEKLSIQNGIIHFEAKSTSTGPVPIEVNLRMGGDEVRSFVLGAWGIDLVEYAAKVACGIYIPKIQKFSTPNKYIAGQYFLTDHSGMLIRLDIDDALHKDPHLEEIHFFKEVGDPLLVPPEGYESLGWVTVSGENVLDAQDNLKKIIRNVHYDVARFHPASSLGKTLRKSKFSFAALNKNIVTRAAKIERIRRVSIENQRNLHIGIAGNMYESDQDGVEGELMMVGENILKTLQERGYGVTFFDFNNVAEAYRLLKESNVDIVFNVCERINASSLLEPHAAALLDILQIPYTGSNPFTLGLCLDKIRVKKLLSYHNIPTPKWDYAYSLDDSIRNDLQYPLIVKPGNTDNSIGITNDSVVTTKDELRAQLKKVITDIGRPALVEEYIEGDEYDVSIIGSDENDLRVLPLSRSIFKELPKGYWHIYPFEAKFTDDAVYKKIIVQRPPKNVSKKLESLISEIALDTYNILDCHDYGRVEVRVDEDENPYVIELNPNPSINIRDCVPSVADLAGLNYGDFLEEIIRLSIFRYRNRPPYDHLQANIL